LFLAIGAVNYLYKISAAIALTPLIYVMRRAIQGYLGKEQAASLEARAGV